jgi:ADP-heptose:LPS heptosyltransferase
MRIEAKQRLDRRLGWTFLVPLRPLVRLAGRLAHRDHRTAPQGEIAVVKLLGGGSLLLAFPALLGLKRRYPALPLTIVCGPGVRPFAEAVGLFDRIDIVDDQRGFAALAASSVRVLAALVGRRVDTVLDLEVYSVLSTVFSSLTCARNRVGFYLENTYWRRNLHTHLVFFNRSAGVFHFYDALARLLGAEPASIEECRAHLAARLAGEEASGPARVALDALGGADVVAVGAGCSELGRVRQLPVGEWCAFARRHAGPLCEAHWVFLGGPGDREVSEAVGRALAGELGPGAFRWTNLCGELPLASSLAVLVRARRFIGVDSALLHAARLLGVPGTSFWGPTSPATRLRPIAGLAEEIHYRPPVCSPCIHVAEEPPCKGDNVCMQLLSRDVEPLVLWCEDSTGASVRPPVTR